MTDLLEPSIGEQITTPLIDEAIEKSWVNSRLGAATAGAMVLSEMLPINFAALAEAHRNFGDSALTTALFTAATLATETAGAIASADLLDAGVANKPIKWAHSKLAKFRIAGKDTNAPQDFALTVVSGTVALNLIKQTLNDERTRAQNRKYSVLMGLGNSAVSGTAAWFVSEGVYHPNPESITLGSASLVALVGLTRLAKNMLPAKKAFLSRFRRQ